MEIIRGKVSRGINQAELATNMAGYKRILIDLGTGDGRFVRHVAENHPGTFVIGVDACRENLRVSSRQTPVNALFVIANAQALPRELHRLADQVTINFPWGSLLKGLLEAEPVSMDQLLAITRPGALLDVRLNAGALAELGCPLEKGVRQIEQALLANGFCLTRPITLDIHGLRSCPTTWARRLAVGRDPRAVALSGVLPEPKSIAGRA